MTVDELKTRAAELLQQREHAAAHLNFVNGQLTEVQTWIAKAAQAESGHPQEETP